MKDLVGAGLNDRLTRLTHEGGNPNPTPLDLSIRRVIEYDLSLATMHLRQWNEASIVRPDSAPGIRSRRRIVCDTRRRAIHACGAEKMDPAPDS